MQQSLKLLLFLSICIVAASPSFASSTTQPEDILQLAPQIPWKHKLPGLDLAEVELKTFPPNTEGQLRIVRINPNFFQFCLHSIGKTKSYPKTLAQWAHEAKLVSAINASMYLPDGQTSTGYMRSGDYTNNPKRVSKFGAYFLAQPRNKKLISARIVERNHPQLEQLLKEYTMVIQNYRLISAKRNILWSKGGQKHSISAVGEDKKGNILFFHCAKPLDAHSFAEIILKLPLYIQTVMYVEGGVQAGMVLRVNEEEFFWGGRHPAEFFLGNVGVALPNILGVKAENSNLSQ